MFSEDTVTTLNHSSKPIQPKSCGTIQYKPTDALIISNSISSYPRKTPEPEPS